LSLEGLEGEGRALRADIYMKVEAGGVYMKSYTESPVYPLYSKALYGRGKRL